MTVEMRRVDRREHCDAFMVDGATVGFCTPPGEATCVALTLRFGDNAMTFLLPVDMAETIAPCLQENATTAAGGGSA